MTIHVATVSVVFDRGAGAPRPRDVARALFAHPDVVTVRVSDHGRPSVFRADLGTAVESVAAEAVGRIARAAAEEVGAVARVASVVLVADAERPLHLDG